MKNIQVEYKCADQFIYILVLIKADISDAGYNWLQS